MIDFLSKEGTFFQGRWWFRRIFKRVLDGSNCSDVKNLTKEEHRFMVGLGIRAYAENNIGVRTLSSSRI
jgi:hypothetical protein